MNICTGGLVDIKGKVLIGIGTCDKFEYSEKHCLDLIRKLDYENYDVLLVDNSKDINHYFDLIKKYPDFTVKHLKRPQYFRDAVGQVRKFIVDYCVMNNYDYLFFVDIDFLIKPDTLDKLVDNNVDFVTTIIGYMHKETTTIFRPIKSNKQINMISGMPAVRGITWREFDEGKLPDLIPIVYCGLSCALIKTKWLIGMNFYIAHSHMAFMEDGIFCRDMQRKGAKLFCNTTLKPFHLHIFMGERMMRQGTVFKALTRTK